jgi:4-hydroxy-tetrahydrodipicolinate synthase
MNWNGVFPAVTTKFTQDDQLDIDKFRYNISEQVKAGVDGIILGGTLGEASSLTNDEKIILLENALDEVGGRAKVIVNIAEQTTSAAVNLAKNLEQNGADGLMLLPPMRYAADSRETVAYFRAVASATELPTIIRSIIRYQLPYLCLET